MVINTHLIAFRLFNIIQVQFQFPDTVFALQVAVHEMLLFKYRCHDAAIY